MQPELRHWVSLLTQWQRVWTGSMQWPMIFIAQISRNSHVPRLHRMIQGINIITGIMGL